jgi:hypothetical protein
LNLSESDPFDFAQGDLKTGRILHCVTFRFAQLHSIQNDTQSDTEQHIAAFGRRPEILGLQFIPLGLEWSRQLFGGWMTRPISGIKKTILMG